MDAERTVQKFLHGHHADWRRASAKRSARNEIGNCFTLVTSTMRAVLTERFIAHGGAIRPPVAASADTPTLVLVPSGSSGDQSDIRRQAFGHRLHAARERSGVTLEEIAKATKVSTTLLATLERGDASRWPKGIFRRAFFRDYVVAIGLPAEPLVTEFLQLFPDGEVHPIAVAPVSRQPEAGRSLRLLLESPPCRRLTRARVRRELIELIPALMLAAGITVWTDSTPWTAAAVLGLCYYHRLTAAAWRFARRRQATLNRDATNP